PRRSFVRPGRWRRGLRDGPVGGQQGEEGQQPQTQTHHDYPLRARLHDPTSGGWAPSNGLGPGRTENACTVYYANPSAIRDSFFVTGPPRSHFLPPPKAAAAAAGRSLPA